MILLFLVSYACQVYLFYYLNSTKRSLRFNLDYERIKKKFEVDGKLNQKLFREYAEYDRRATDSGHGIGIYQTYCHLNSKLFNSLDNYWNASEEDQYICNDYQFMWWKIKTLSILISCSVQIFNIIVKEILVWLIEYREFNDKHRRTIMSYYGIFVFVFLNSAVSQVIANLNTQDTSLGGFLPKLGLYKDFSREWFLNIGPQLWKSSVLHAINPLTDFVIAWLKRELLIAKDEYKCYCCCCCKRSNRKTSQKSLRNYVQIHQGLRYQIHVRYAYISIQIYMMFTYGLFIPMIIPTVLLGIFINAVFDYYLLIKVYTTPPEYPHKLLHHVLSTLRLAPMCMFIFAFFVLGNRQTFHNEPDIYKTWTSDLADPNHGINEPLSGPFHSWRKRDFHSEHLNNILFQLWVIYIIVRIYFFLPKEDVMSRCDAYDHKSFFECMSPLQQQEWIATEFYQRKYLGIRTLEDKALLLLVRTFISYKEDKKLLYHWSAAQNDGFIRTNNYNYEMLFQPQMEMLIGYLKVGFRKSRHW